MVCMVLMLYQRGSSEDAGWETMAACNAHTCCCCFCGWHCCCCWYRCSPRRCCFPADVVPASEDAGRRWQLLAPFFSETVATSPPPRSHPVTSRKLGKGQKSDWMEPTTAKRDPKEIKKGLRSFSISAAYEIVDWRHRNHTECVYTPIIKRLLQN